MLVFAQDTIDWRSGVSDAWSDLVSFLPKLLAFLLVLIIGWIVARIIRSLVTRGLRAIKFDRIIDRSGLGAPLERAGYADSGRFIAGVIYFLIWMLVLQIAFSTFGDNPISDALDGIIAFIPNLIVAIAIVILTGVIANAVGGMLRGALSGVSYGSFLTTAAVAAIWVIGGFMALDQIEFAADIVDTLFTALVSALSLIFVLSFGIGGIWAARDRFWPAVYDRLTGTVQQDQVSH